MGTRNLAVGALLVCASMLQAQQRPSLYRIELVPSGTMVALGPPEVSGQSVVFAAWPDGATTKLQQARVKKITQIVGKMPDTVYQIELNPSGTVLARDIPVLKNGSFQFHTWRSGTLMSIRQAEVRRIGALNDEQAFWAEQAMMGETNIGNVAWEGTNSVVSIGTPPPSRSQAGPSSMSSIGSGGQGNAGISGAPAYGNWLYQGTPGVSDAYAPANATMNNGVPTMPAATNGGSPPRQ